MLGETNLGTLIASMAPILNDDEFVFVTLKTEEPELLSKLEPISTFREKEGVSLIITEQSARENSIQYTGVYKCITLSIHSSLEAVGLTAAISTKLTSVNISANVVAAYFHDHVFVSTDDASKAMDALTELANTGR